MHPPTHLFLFSIPNWPSSFKRPLAAGKLCLVALPACLILVCIWPTRTFTHLVIGDDWLTSCVVSSVEQDGLTLLASSLFVLKHMGRFYEDRYTAGRSRSLACSRPVQRRQPVPVPRTRLKSTERYRRIRIEREREIEYGSKDTIKGRDGEEGVPVRSLATTHDTTRHCPLGRFIDRALHWH